MSVVGVIGFAWMLTLHFVLNCMGARKDYYLIRKWMVLMNEMPTQNGADYKAVGLPPDAAERFWAAENQLNYVWYRVINVCLVVACFVFCAQQFFISFETDIVTYVLLQTLHIAFNSIAIIGYLHSIYTTNLFYLEVMKLLAKKFAHLSGQVRLLGQPKTDKINNQKLANLIYE